MFRAIQRRLPLVATLRRSRSQGGVQIAPPPPTGRVARQNPTGRGLTFNIRPLFLTRMTTGEADMNRSWLVAPMVHRSTNFRVGGPLILYRSPEIFATKLLF